MKKEELNLNLDQFGVLIRIAAIINKKGNCNLSGENPEFYTFKNQLFNMGKDINQIINELIDLKFVAIYQNNIVIDEDLLKRINNKEFIPTQNYSVEKFDLLNIPLNEDLKILSQAKENQKIKGDIPPEFLIKKKKEKETDE